MHKIAITSADIGNAIQKRRKALKLTQDDLSQLVGVGRKFISSVENGKETAQIGLILDLCRELGIELTLSAGGGYGEAYGQSYGGRPHRSHVPESDK